MLRTPSRAQGTAGFEATGQGTFFSGLEPSLTCPELLWVGRPNSLEAELVERAGIPFRGIDAAGVRGMGLLTRARNLVHVMRGLYQAYRIIGQFRPQVIFVTGGYVSVPVVLAGWLRRIPVVIYLPDIVPGLAIRSLAHLATHLAVSFAASRQYLPAAKVVVTGYPVRSALFAADAAGARQRLGLAPDEKTLLIFGGSQGARRINRAVGEVLPALLEQAQMLHISGRLDFEEMQHRSERLPVTLKNRYHLFAYLHQEMVDALAAADLVVARAGAATLGELPAVGAAAVLVPGAFAGAHQAENAAVLVEAGGAVVIPDAELTGQRLVETITPILSDRERLATMRSRMSRLAQPDAARQLAALLGRAAGQM